MATYRTTALAVLLTVGCGGAPTQAANNGRPKPVRGLDSPENDPAMVSLAKGILATKYKVGSAYASDCTPCQAWFGTNLWNSPKGQATLVSMLEDDSARVRELAAEYLNMHSGNHDYGTDAALSGRVVAAAQRETVPELMGPWGSLLARIDLGAHGLEDPVLRLATDGPVTMRKTLVEGVFKSNPYSLPVFALVRDALADSSSAIRAAAIASFRGVADREVCAVLEGELAKHPDLASDAAMAIADGGNGSCASSFDAVLTWLEARPRGAETPSLEIVEKLCSNRVTSVAEQQRGAKILRRWADHSTLDASVRSGALRALPACDVDSAAYVAKFKNDADPDIRRAATDVASIPSRATGPAHDTLGPPEPEPPPIEQGVPIRHFASDVFHNDWVATPAEALPSRFPRGPYRMSGTVVGITELPRGRVDLMLRGRPGHAIRLEFAASQAKGARNMRRGMPAQALCDFRGASYGGYLTLEQCRWETPK